MVYVRYAGGGDPYDEQQNNKKGDGQYDARRKI
jgi:hypothetical protein